MVWDSVSLTTFIDLAVAVGGICIAILVYKNRAFFRSSRNTGNLLIIAAGGLVIAGFFGADLFTALVLPKWTGMTEAMSAMEQLHNKVIWIALPLGFGAVTAGFALTFRSVVGLIAKANLNEQELGAKISELESTEKRYRNLVENAQLGIRIENADGIRLFANNACATMFGYESPDEYLNALSVPGTMIATHDRDRMLKNLEARIQGRNASNNYEYDALRKDGSVLPVQVFVGETTWDGNPALQRTYVDLSDRKEAEQSLRQSEESLAKAQHLAKLGNWTWNFLTGELYWSDETYRILGFEPQEFTPTYDTVLNCVHPDDRELVEHHITRALKEKASYSIDHRICLASGEERVVYEQGTVEFDSAGQPVRMSGTTQDITDRKRAEAGLQQSEARYRDLFEGSILPIQITTVDGSSRYVNQSYLDLLGYETSQEFFEFRSKVIAPYDRDRIIDMADARKRGESVPDIYEYDVVKKDGTVLPLQSFSRKISWDGKEAFQRTLVDLTERKRAEAAQIGAKEQAELANRAKSEFLANMSHELRTPLNAIIGFSETIHKQTFGPVGSPKYLEYVDDIHQAGRHLLNVINDILDLSKIEAGKVELHEETVNVSDIVEACVLLVKERAESEGLNLKSDVPEALPALYADERMVKQILINLLSNAIKFTPAGGEVSIKVWSRPDAGYVFQIADTGIGIALEDIPVILTPFKQADGALDRKFDGTGLGLPLSKSLTEMHGGSFDLQSEVGIGTTVTVRFPAERIVSLSATGT